MEQPSGLSRDAALFFSHLRFPSQLFAVLVHSPTPNPQPQKTHPSSVVPHFATFQQHELQNDPQIDRRIARC